jgi:hypothetical protein
MRAIAHARTGVAYMAHNCEEIRGYVQHRAKTCVVHMPLSLSLSLSHSHTHSHTHPHTHIHAREPGVRTRYSDSLRAGQSGDRIPVGSEIFLPCQNWQCDPPRLLYSGYRFSSPKVKRWYCGDYHPI